MNLKFIFVLFWVFTVISVPFASGYSGDSPREQFSKGIDPHDVKCKENFEIVFKNSDFSPACVKSTSVQKLIERNWASDHDPYHM